MASKPVDARIRDILISLLRRTQNGKVNWQLVNEPDTNVVSYSTTSSTVLLSTRDDDGVAPYIVEIENSSGTPIERVSIAPSSRLDSVGAEALEALRELYPLARRSSLHVDELLDQLVDELTEEEEEEE